jgi:hypothetical protein
MKTGVLAMDYAIYLVLVFGVVGFVGVAAWISTFRSLRNANCSDQFSQTLKVYFLASIALCVAIAGVLVPYFMIVAGSEFGSVTIEHAHRVATTVLGAIWFLAAVIGGIHANRVIRRRYASLDNSSKA